MPTNSLGSLTLDLVARIGGFVEPLKQAGQVSKRQMRQMRADAKDAAAGFAAFSAAATAAGAGVVAFTNNAAQGARELKNQAALANSSTQEFQRFSYAAKTVGVEQGKLGDILKDTSDRVGDFLTTGGGEMADWFEKIAPRIGVTAEEFRNLSGPQALQKFYDGLEKANLSQSEMTFFMESIADEATALIPLLRNGGAGFAELAGEADKLGIVLSSGQLGALDEFAGQFDRLAGIMSAGSSVVAAELAPALSGLADELVEVAVAFQDGDYDTQVALLTNIGTVAAGAAGAYATYRGAVAAATIAQWAFNAAANANPFGALVTVAGAAAGAIYTYREEIGLTDPVARAADEAMMGLAGSIAAGDEAALNSSYEALTLELQSVSLEAQNAMSHLIELEAREQFYANSHEGVAESVRGSITEQQELLAGLWARQVELQESIEKVQERRKALNGTEDEGNGIREVSVSITRDLAESTDALAESNDDFVSSLASLRRELDPAWAAQQKLAQQTALLDTALQSGALSLDEYLELWDAAATVYGDATAKGKQAAKDLEESFNPALVAMERGVERLDDSFSDAWRNMLDGSESAFSSLKDIALDTLAEIIHAYTTRQITASLGMEVGGTGGQSGGLNMSSLSGMAKNLFGGGTSAASSGGLYASAATSSTGLYANAATGGVASGGGMMSSMGSMASTLGPYYALAMLGNEAFKGVGLYDALGIKTDGELSQALGSVIPIGGTIIGSGMDALGWGHEKTPSEFSYQSDYAQYGGRDSALSSTGQFGFDIQRLNDEMREALDGFASTLSQSDAALTDTFTGQQISDVQKAMAEFSYSGMSFADMAADRLDTILNAAGIGGDLYDRMREDYQGEDAGQRLQAVLNIRALEQALESVPDNVLSHVEDRLATSDAAIGELSQSLSIQIQQWEVLGGQLETIVPTFDRLSMGAVDVTNALNDAAGGMEALQSLQSSYYANYFSEAEQAAHLQERLTEQFQALNMTLPASRDEFRSIVESLDLTSASGRETYLTMLGLQDSFAQLTDTALYAQQEISQAARSLYSGGAMDAINGALATFNGTANTIDDIAATRQAQLEDEKRAITSLGDLIDSLSVSDLATGSTLDAAQRQFRAALGAGDADAVTGTARTYLEQAKANASSALEYARIYGEVTSGVTGLQDQFEENVDELGDLERIADRQLAEQERARQTLIDQLRTQIDMLDGIHTFSGLLDTLPASIADQLEGIIATDGKYGEVLPDGVYTDDSGFSGTQKTINDLYQGILGRNADESGLDYWTGQLAGGMSLSEIRARMEDQAAHGYHANGIADVPFDGYRAVLHKGEDVLPANIAKLYRDGAPSGNSELIAEVKALRQQVSDLQASNAAIASSNAKLASDTDRMRRVQEEEANA